MSRIAGLIATDPGTRGPNLLGEMLQVISSSGWQQDTLCRSRYAAGWAGWAQPNLAKDDRIAVVMDGCLFNRDELPGGVCDAERILRLIEEFGIERTVQRLNGDFAIAVFDSRRETLSLIRDRIGAKPLYYADVDQVFAFASRIRSLLTLPHVSTDVNHSFVARFAGSHYRYFDNDPDVSPFAEIKQVPAGCILTRECGRPSSVARYWTLQDLPNWDDGEEELAERYRDLLTDAVARRVDVADRPGFTLSGGMDSSSVLACAVRHRGEKQHAFSTVYEDKTYDESDEIRSMLEQTVCQWHTVPLDRPEVLDVVSKMVATHDEPVATATWLSHYQLCEQASEEGFASLFGGLGGDELNAGEYEYFLYHFADMVATGQDDRLNHEVDKWVEYHDHPVFKKSRAMARRELDKIRDSGRPWHCLVEPTRLNRYVATVQPEFYELSAFTPVMDHPFRSYLKNRTFQDMFRETAPCCLRAEDRQATEFGLENFLPFFDHRLIEFMFRVPGHLKIRDGVTKILLRRAMQGILPDETRQRIKKTGWNAPAHVWFSGAGREPLMDLVRSRAFRERGIYDVPKVEAIIAEHQEIMEHGKVQENHMMFLWQLVNLELWLRDVDRITSEKQSRRLSRAS